MTASEEAHVDYARVLRAVTDIWEEDIIPKLTEYIKIPNVSPHFDAAWAEHGYMEDAVHLMERWARDRIAGLGGASIEVVRLPGRTPLIYIDVPSRGAATGGDGILLYGHLDKQPGMNGWLDGLGPWTPVLRDERLYGRGGADDGYALFAIIGALMALEHQTAPRSRCIILIEACEESGSYDLPAYVDHLRARIGKPSLIICLDSACGNYEQLWMATSLRGAVGGKLSVRVLSEGIHSGLASGVVPCSFRVVRQLLSRLEDEMTGEIKPDAFRVEVPQARLGQAHQAAAALNTSIYNQFPLVEGMRPVTDSHPELVLNRTWRAQLTVTGASGLPLPELAGNVLRPRTTLKLSLRIPPTLDSTAAAQALKRIMESEPPYGAEVSLDPDPPVQGWDAPAQSPWLSTALERASCAFFGKPPAYTGEGGSIPFMGMLPGLFPGAQFVVTGVLGPGSNAHGPNEFLHLPTGKRITAVVAALVAGHALSRVD